MFLRPALTALLSASMLVAPVSAYATPTSAPAGAANGFVSSMFGVASSVMCLGAPGGCVLPVKPAVTTPTPQPVTQAPVAEVTEAVAEESGGFGLGGILLGLLGAAGIVAGILAITDNDDDVPASP